MDKELEIAFNSIPLFSDQSLDTVTVERLGGLTNRNFLIATSKGKYVLRLAGEGTDEYIDRIREKKNAEVAVKAGVNAEILFFDEVSGTMVTRFIDNAVTMDIDKFKDAGALERTGQAFRKLHQSPDLFEGEFELFNQIDQYLEVLKKLGASLPDGYSEVQKSASARRALPTHPAKGGVSLRSHG